MDSSGGGGEWEERYAEVRGVMSVSPEVNDCPTLRDNQLSSGGSCLGTPFVFTDLKEDAFELSDADLLLLLLSLTFLPWASSMTVSTLRSLDSDLRVN
jgi:hypothetical protein